MSSGHASNPTTSSEVGVKEILEFVFHVVSINSIFYFALTLPKTKAILLTRFLNPYLPFNSTGLVKLGRSGKKLGEVVWEQSFGGFYPKFEGCMDYLDGSNRSLVRRLDPRLFIEGEAIVIQIEKKETSPTSSIEDYYVHFFKKALE